MNNIPKAWKWIIGSWLAILLATLTFKYFTDWRYPVPKDSPIIISLSKGGWLSPTYKLTIYGDGTIVYEGVERVGAVGIRKKKIEVIQIKELADKIEQLGFFELEDRYYPPVRDAGGVSIHVKIGENDKSVLRVDPPSTAAGIEIPDNLYRIEGAIAAAGNPDLWVKCDFKSRSLCGMSPLAPIASAYIFGLTLWMIWGFIQRRKTYLGILLGFGIFLAHGAIVWIANWSFPTKEVSVLLVIFELVALLPASLILFWLYKQKTKVAQIDA